MSRADDAFDAGITALRENDLPAAIAKLVEARMYSPADTEISSALLYARFTAQTTSHVELPPLRPTDAALGWVVVNMALAVAIARRLRRSWKLGLGIAWLACAGCWSAVVLTRPEYAVVAKPEVAVHVADDETSLERYRLKAGDELVIEGKLGEWLKVKSGAGELGYVKAEQVIEVKLGTHEGR